MKPLSRPAAPRSRAAACLLAGCTAAPTIAARPPRRTRRPSRAPATGVDHGARAERMVARAQRSPARRPDHRRARVQPRSALRRPLARITRAARATTCGPVAEIVGHRRRHPHARAGRQRARFAAAVERLKPIGRHLAVAGSRPLQLYSAGFDATWEIDLFGGTRRAVEAASAQAKRSTPISPTRRCRSLPKSPTRTSTCAINSSGLRCRGALPSCSRRCSSHAAASSAWRCRRCRHRTPDDASRKHACIADPRAVTESLDRLTILTGRAPGALDAALSTSDAPPDATRQRRDRRSGHAAETAPRHCAAERRLASSNAQIGEHVADYFPKVTLLGDLGFSATDPGHLFRKQNFTWVGAPYLQWNILDFGRTRGAVRAAEASRRGGSELSEGGARRPAGCQHGIAALRAPARACRCAHQGADVGRAFPVADGRAIARASHR